VNYRPQLELLEDRLYPSNLFSGLAIDSLKPSSIPPTGFSPQDGDQPAYVTNRLVDTQKLPQIRIGPTNDEGSTVSTRESATHQQSVPANLRQIQPPVLPPPPRDVQAEVVSGETTDVSITWNYPDAGAQSFSIERSTTNSIFNAQRIGTQN